MSYAAQQQSQPAATSPPTSQLGVFADVPHWMLSVAVLFYLLGWGYLFGYYSSFGVSLGELTLQMPEVLLAAQRLLFAPSVLGVLILALLIRVLYSSFIAEKRSPEDPPPLLSIRPGLWIGLSIFVIVGLLPYAALRIGRSDAARDTSEETSTLPIANFQVDRAQYLRDPLPDPMKYSYRLLAHGKSGYFLFVPIRKTQDSLQRNISLLFVPDGAVLGGEITSRLSQGGK